MISEPLKVLIVDDEPEIRSCLKDILSKKYETYEAGDAQTAMSVYGKMQPDIIITDMKMPGESGLWLMGKIKAQCLDIPIIMITGHGDKNMAIDAIKQGAFDFIEKPFSSIELMNSVSRAAGICMLRKLDARVYEKYLDLNRTKKPGFQAKLHENYVIGIGASFGGTEAILEILLGLPANMPPIVIVQHLPVDFTAPFARQLDSACPFQVKEAEDGETLKAGVVLIAPSGKRFRVIKGLGGSLMVKLSNEASGALYTPSVDEMFESLGEAAGKSAIGIILTGMGADGASGLLKLRLNGGQTIAQNKESSVIFGMPAKAIELGGVEQEAHLKEIAGLIISRIAKV